MISNPSLKLSIQCPVHSVAWLTLSAVVSGGKQFLWGRIWSTTTYQVHWVSASKFVRAESQLSSSDTSLKCTCFFKHESYVLLIIKYNSMFFFFIHSTWGHTFATEEILPVAVSWISQGDVFEEKGCWLKQSYLLHLPLSNAWGYKLQKSAYDFKFKMPKNHLSVPCMKMLG